MADNHKKFERYTKQARSLVKEGNVKDIVFSRGTYQVLVKDPVAEEEIWVFLQFDNKGGLRDFFCSEDEEVKTCLHVASAYVRIFMDSTLPLHLRFEKSLWNALSTAFAKELGFDSALLHINDNTYQGIMPAKEKVFQAKALTEKGISTLKKIFVDRVEETEETSLKFSNLTEEEITDWKRGTPSFDLAYELSFWCDLAKWLFLQQDEGQKYTLRFAYSPQQIPEKLFVDFEQVALEFQLSQMTLEKIIPSLSHVDSSPLKVFGKPSDAIESMTFDPKKNTLTVNPKTKNDSFEQKPKGILLKDWVYLPKEGFFPRENHPLLKQLVYNEKDIGALFDRYYEIVLSKLKNVRINKKPTSTSYHLFFDVDWNLNIQTYVFKPGDLLKIFGEWGYLSSEQFVRLEDLQFGQQVAVVIKCESVPSFIQQRREWLNQQPGFKTHVAPIRVRLGFEMTENKSIVFTTQSAIDDDSVKTYDFQPWIYIENEGFYKKRVSSSGGIVSGTIIKQEQIPFFLRMYQDELSLIPRFFTEKTPIEKMGLRIDLTPLTTITISPEFTVKAGYKREGVELFEGYTYVQGQGFCPVPEKMRLPERLMHEIELNKENFPRFFSYEFEQIKKFAIYIDPRLNWAKEMRLIASEFTFKKPKYYVQFFYQTSKGKIPFLKLWESMRQRCRFVFTSCGLLDLDEPRFRWMRRLQVDQLEGNTLKLSSLELLRLYAFEPFEVVEKWQDFDQLISFEAKTEPNVKDFQGLLRPYQEIGFKWMWFLYEKGFSGILADDMGLGKTYQAMALIAALRSEKKRHFLIVCPTSVIYHWEDKLSDCLPEFRICTYHGAKRSFEDFHKDYDILLTSYGIWRNENLLLKQIFFEVAVFDEIQAAKNQASRLHASLLNVKAHSIIGLTGTPIENKLAELKSLFDIILPGYMPSMTEYRDFFVNPIEKEQDAKKKALLSRYIRPFVLRRTKSDVLPDLPEKTEEISHCALSQEQKLLYNSVLAKMRGSLVQQIEDKSTPIPYVHIFSLLSSLKQICNHPAAFLKTPESYDEHNSGKWELFVELLNEALESGQKVVVFSQYLAMLDIIESYLKKNRIGFSSIRGATKNRGGEVLKFNRDPLCSVFLGSLGAAGLGIDLTAGSVVIHYDRWWNAAREDQATDRVHRIGQTRGVQVFKLVTKGTFEERIDEMITAKAKLMKDVVTVDDSRFVKTFDRNEILKLLSLA